MQLLRFAFAPRGSLSFAISPSRSIFYEMEKLEKRSQPDSLKESANPLPEGCVRVAGPQAGGGRGVPHSPGRPRLEAKEQKEAAVTLLSTVKVLSFSATAAITINTHGACSILSGKYHRSGRSAHAHVQREPYGAWQTQPAAWDTCF